MLLASDFDLSRYLKAADLGEIGSEKRAKIKTITKETNVGERQETKACVWFTNLDKGLLLNKTNLRTLQGAFGDAMDAWAGRIVVLYSIMTDFRGQMGPALRVKIPPPKDRYRAPPPKQASKRAPKPPVDEDEDIDGWDEPEQLNDDVSDVR